MESFYEEAEVKLWNGLRLLAVDGSVVNLPHSKSIIEQFGTESYVQKKGSAKSLARAYLTY